MNSDIFAGKMKQMQGKLREQWGKLTDSDWEEIGGKKDVLIGKLQERYGYAREEAEEAANKIESMKNDD